MTFQEFADRALNGHLAVVGSSRSGKTQLLQQLMSATTKPADFLYVSSPNCGTFMDEDGWEYQEYWGDRYPTSIARTPQSLSDLLRMEFDVCSRIANIANAAETKTSTPNFPTSRLVIDDWDAIYPKCQALNPKSHKYIENLLLRGRAAGLFLTIAAQTIQSPGIAFFPLTFLRQMNILLIGQDAVSSQLQRLARLFGVSDKVSTKKVMSQCKCDRDPNTWTSSVLLDRHGVTFQAIPVAKEGDIVNV